MWCTGVTGWLGSRVVSELDSDAEGPGFKSQSRRCRVTVLGKLFTPICLTHTFTQTFNGPLSGTTQVSRYHKGETNLDFTEARDSE